MNNRPNFPLLYSRLEMWCRSAVPTIHRLIAPHSRREDEARREYILNVLLLILILVVLILGLTTAYLQVRLGSTRGGVSLLTLAVVAVGFSGLLWLSRRGHHILASCGLLLVFLVPTIYSIYHWGTLLVMPLLGCALIIILTSTLLGTRYGAILTGIMIVTLAFIQHGISTGQIHTDIRWLQNPVHETYTIQLGILFGAIMFITWLAERQIESSLRRARRSEKQVLQERDRLEGRVEERTLQLKRAQQESLHAVMQLAEFGRLSSGYFHDLVNPITAVSLQLELLQVQSIPDPATQKQVASAHLATSRLIEFIRAIQRQLHDRPVYSHIDITQEITQAIDVLSHKIRHTEVTVTQKNSGDVSYYGNPLKFFQIVVNLLGNAVDACSQNQADISRAISIVTETNQGGLTLTVRDTGPGIDPLILPQIFESFTTTKGPTAGSGLGMAIVKSVVEQDFGGQITIAETGPHGTTFTVQLPQFNSH